MESASYVIQNGTGPYSAIWCLGTGVVAGDLVDISGSVSEVYGLRQIARRCSQQLSLQETHFQRQNSLLLEQSMTSSGKVF